MLSVWFTNSSKDLPSAFELTPPWNHLTLPGCNSPRRAANSSTNTVRSRASVLRFTALRPAHNDYFRAPPVSCAAPLKDLQGKAGLKAEQFAAALVVFTVFLVYCIIGGSLIVNVVGFVYPATQSVQVLSSGGDNEADLKQWLTYWIVFALFNVLEMATSMLEEFIPFYFLFKCIKSIGVYSLWCFYCPAKVLCFLL